MEAANQGVRKRRQAGAVLEGGLNTKRLDVVQAFTETGGEGGIRTHGTRKGSTVFETARFNRSRTSPGLVRRGPIATRIYQYSSPRGLLSRNCAESLGVAGCNDCPP